ncbi:hypothetical protein EVAR_94331_1 [Eumeta japonica]|uniref:Uncharacterized protein n=1 Tax=Eumeta variegata TaxID=151549 RepID=A0A4C1TPT0_EUMVA|nr:hypothetical protein EVAR_94331_1 [Eumeta japonica]
MEGAKSYSIGCTEKMGLAPLAPSPFKLTSTLTNATFKIKFRFHVLLITVERDKARGKEGMSQPRPVSSRDYWSRPIARCEMKGRRAPLYEGLAPIKLQELIFTSTRPRKDY